MEFKSTPNPTNQTHKRFQILPNPNPYMKSNPFHSYKPNRTSGDSNQTDLYVLIELALMASSFELIQNHTQAKSRNQKTYPSINVLRT